MLSALIPTQPLPWLKNCSRILQYWSSSSILLHLTKVLIQTSWSCKFENTKYIYIYIQRHILYLDSRNVLIKHGRSDHCNSKLKMTIYQRCHVYVWSMFTCNSSHASEIRSWMIFITIPNICSRKDKRNDREQHKKMWNIRLSLLRQYYVLGNELHSPIQRHSDKLQLTSSIAATRLTSGFSHKSQRMSEDPFFPSQNSCPSLAIKIIKWSKS